MLDSRIAALVAQALQGQAAPQMPTRIAQPDMSGGFGLSSDNWMRMFGARSQQAAAEAGLQAEAARFAQDQKLQDQKLQMDRQRMGLDAKATEAGIANDAARLGLEGRRVSTDEARAAEEARRSKVNESMAKKGFKLDKKKAAFEMGDGTDLDKQYKQAQIDYYGALAGKAGTSSGGASGERKPISVSDIKTVDELADSRARDDVAAAMGAAGDTFAEGVPIPAEFMQEYLERKELYRKYFASQLPGYAPGPERKESKPDFDFTGAMKPGW